MMSMMVMMVVMSRAVRTSTICHSMHSGGRRGHRGYEWIRIGEVQQRAVGAHHAQTIGVRLLRKYGAHVFDKGQLALFVLVHKAHGLIVSGRCDHVMWWQVVHGCRCRGVCHQRCVDNRVRVVVRSGVCQRAHIGAVRIAVGVRRAILCADSIRRRAVQTI